jgi:hypothetical protein
MSDDSHNDSQNDRQGDSPQSDRQLRQKLGHHFAPPRFYLTARDRVELRDNRIRLMARRVKAALPWVEAADMPSIRTWCELEYMASAAYIELRDHGMLTSAGHARDLVNVYTRLRRVQLQYERELGMTPRARAQLKLDKRDAFDLAAHLASGHDGTDAELKRASGSNGSNAPEVVEATEATGDDDNGVDGEDPDVKFYREAAAQGHEEHEEDDT